MIILDIDKPERCGKCPMHNDGNDYCKLAHDHASFVRAKGCPIQTIKTGHWIEVTNGRGGHECDICHDYAPSYQSGDEYLTIYCPNCGAKMAEPQERSE